ncbi:MAG: GIY-YIG nuclease family protein [Saprospiraceae bacterium]|nr:GIY-YIG nuclease family protein [Saprospiraceae bacterium]
MAGKLYAVVDIETTGGLATRDRITEIAIVLYDGHKITGQYSSLVNPERSIPIEITRITGITNAMVAEAPKFYEIAKNIVEMTEGAVFVAHNVRFDYSFIQEEFRQLGYTFTRKHLCTVQLSRKAFPGLQSYSLGNLIRHFGIGVENRHRALDDTLATVDVLSRILNKEDGIDQAERLINAGIKEVNLPQNITLDKLHSLPETPGVYYFYNTYGTVIYVGKAINIKKRVFQHFSKTDSKAEKLALKAADISVEETGHELIALLLESKEIKLLQPEVNKAQRTKEYPYFIHWFNDDKGYINFKWEKSSVKTRIDKQIINHYGSKESARSHLASVCSEAQLCYCKSGLFESTIQCFYHQTQECIGAGVGAEHNESYNLRASVAVDILKRKFDDNFIVLLRGRQVDEKAVILVEEGHYRGFGYTVSDSGDQTIEDLKECIKYVSVNPECNQILKNYLEKSKDFTLIRF